MPGHRKGLRKKLVDRSVYELIGKIEGVLLSIYMILKIADTAYWAFVQSPGSV